MTANTNLDQDFATLLAEAFEASDPGTGDVVTGVILSNDGQGLVVDVGLKSDGLVPWSDIERLGRPVDFKIGQKIQVMINREDEDGNLLVSVSQAMQVEDWTRAEQVMENDETCECIVVDANKGGVIVQFGNLNGFIPASHISTVPRSQNEDDRKYQLRQLTGQTLVCKVIEVNRKRRRLVFSEREAQKIHRDQLKEKLLEQLKEGDVIQGMVSGMRDFGAFVDIGGADGLIHISELAWHRVNHPREVVNIGDKIDVYVLRLDESTRRIELSLKRLQKNPWTTIEERYHVGKLVEGEVKRVADFGAFVVLEPGVEALLHTNEITSAPPSDLAELVKEGDKLLMRVISIEPENQRLGLSLRTVDERDWSAWKSRQEVDPSPEAETSLQLEQPVTTGNPE